MEPKLDELLARLRELDPETWNRLMEFLPAQINRFQDDIAMPVAEGIATYERCKMPAEALLQAYIAALEATSFTLPPSGPTTRVW